MFGRWTLKFMKFELSFLSNSLQNLNEGSQKSLEAIFFRELFKIRCSISL